ncbi:MAG: WYL domain-containing protein [Bacteroidales bacterium]|nr:WYL domain-containing protein [Bacteroidales bacterium]
MPASKNALIRYKTIDQCLQRRNRLWTLEDLIEACSDALYEYEGNMNGISKRTIQLDIQNMRSEKLGYNAPIVVTDHKYYSYSDPKFSITNSPISKQDMKAMSEAVNVIKQLSGFSKFGELEEIVNRLDDHVSTLQHKTKPVIFFEKNDRLRGLNYINTAYDAIVSKRPLILTYKAFKTPEPQTFIFSPYVLREYRNRWFMFGHRNRVNMILNLALDRIESMEIGDAKDYKEDPDFDPETYFDNIVGVTRYGNYEKNIRFWVSAEHTPYIITKPFHKSQELVKQYEDGSADFVIRVIWNKELIRELLGYGNGLIVKSPRHLVKRMQEQVEGMYKNYCEESL